MDRNFESASHNIASYMHPIFRQKAGAWYKAVYEVLTPRQITLGSKIIMIHLDNEMGIGDIMEGTPFATTLIDALETTDIPVSYVQTYTGIFNEVFAKTTTGGEPVGLMKTVGQEKVMVFGTAMTANTLDDINVVDNMTLNFGCQPQFTLSKWVDARISIGERGSFLFLNNYQDDLVETTVEYQGKPLFGGNPVHLVAGSGLILPVDWQVLEGITVHYALGEINGISKEEDAVILSTAQGKAVAEVTVGGQRMRVEGKDGRLVMPWLRL